MPRDLPLGNGQLLVAFDRTYAIRDLCFPHVGMENHVMGRRSRLGLRAEGRSHWIGEKDWVLELDYEEDSLVTKVKARSETLGIELLASDAVDWQRPVLVRRFRLTNLENRTRKVRLFLHHDLDILESDAGNTAYYDTRMAAVIHYKRRRYFLINLWNEGRAGVTEWSCDHRLSRQGRGTAGQFEDGVDLDRNPISLGAVDSTVALELELPSQGQSTCFAWMALGRRYRDVAGVNREMIEAGPEAVLQRTRDYWTSWCRKEESLLELLPDTIARAWKRSLLVVRTQIDDQGGVLAANDSDTLVPGRETYSYVWTRDGAMVAQALDGAGYHEMARRFLHFCRRHISEGGYFLHRYHADGSLASSWLPWIREGKEVIPIQEDETALVLWALGEHYQRQRDMEFVTPFYSGVIRPAADFLRSFRNPKTGLPLPSWDIWEERYGVHAFTVASVVAGLRAAARLAALVGEGEAAARYQTASEEVDAGLDRYLFHQDLGRYARTGYPDAEGYYLDTCLDSSLAGIFLLQVREAGHPRLRSTMEAIRRRLAVPTPVGGIARFEGDPYCRAADAAKEVPGNPWFLCTLWVAEWEMAVAETPEQLQEATRRLEWACGGALTSGVMAEQLHPLTGEPISVSPLTWSHAAFISAACRLARRRAAMATGPA